VFNEFRLTRLTEGKPVQSESLQQRRQLGSIPTERIKRDDAFNLVSVGLDVPEWDQFAFVLPTLLFLRSNIEQCIPRPALLDGRFGE